MRGVVSFTAIATFACSVFAVEPTVGWLVASCDGSAEHYVQIAYDGFAMGGDMLIALHGHGSDRNQFAYDERGECRAARDFAASHGMLYVSPDYRATTSWMGPKAESDMIDLIAKMRRDNNIHRVFICGASMGGTSALTFAALHPDLIAGVVAMNPLADHLSYANFQDAISESFGGDRESAHDEYYRRSALYFPERFTMPVSITTGGQDTAVPPESARELAARIGELNPRVIFILHRPEVGHETSYEDAMTAFNEMYSRAVHDHVGVSFGGKPVTPSFGSRAGVWFYEAEGGEQLLLLGFPTMEKWRAVPTAHGWELDGTPLEEWIGAEGVIRASLRPEHASYDSGPTRSSGQLDAKIADALIEWDWRMRDGIGTPERPKEFAEVLPVLRRRAEAMGAASVPSGMTEEAEYLALHRTIRAKALEALPDAPIMFAKFVPGAMSHQLTQSLGYCSRPGGGLYILEHPGKDMSVRDVTPSNLPAGSFMNPELSPDATKILFSYADVRESPAGTYTGDPELNGLRFCTPERMKIVYSIYESSIEGGVARRLTDDGYDDMFPIYLPSGDIVFSSTRRGGYHRCGMGPCPVFTTSRMGPNGENPHSLSAHETHEWTPVLMPDGRLLYSRWDYVDRNGVLYQQLWTSRPDGGGVRAYYGNNTWNPCGTWEARPVPDSDKVMAIAGPHHAQAAGSVILIDVKKGIDRLDPLTRLTPEVRFAESEAAVMNGVPRCKDVDIDYVAYMGWGGSLLDPEREMVPTEEEYRWQGHCYKSPWPLGETLFIASYSFDPLMGEPGCNFPNQFGIYLCDAANGTRELLYRDPRISSLWARPIERRTLPSEAKTSIDPDLAERDAGTFFLADVTEAWPERLPADRPIKALRLFKVLEKTTPNADQPKVAIGQGALGREVLGTVPVEDDGSAFFELPARTPVYFQALDDHGRAVQTMRSLVYLQPGERESCVGCHDNRQGAMAPAMKALKAQLREPSKVKPCEYPGARPFNYLKLVQPILDAKCVKCHDGTRENCPALTGEQEGWACRSFNVLINHVIYSSWGQEPGNNYEPMTLPLTFGAIPSPLAARLDNGHGGVELTDEERGRIDLWMDSNGACWGTFDWDRQRDL